MHEETIARRLPSPLNYHGFPKSCCTSINEVICHGIPDSTVLKDGDLVNIDITVFYNGFHGDCSEMFFVGDVDPAGQELVRVTYECWQEAINFCKPGRAYKDIGAIIEDYVSKYGYSTVKVRERGERARRVTPRRPRAHLPSRLPPPPPPQSFCGHGIGRLFHTNPNILHYRNNEPNGVMQAGHTLTIEPMINEGTDRSVIWPDKWTVTSSDGRRSAQFEHTLLITPTGVEPLTGKLPTSPVQPWERP